MRKLLRKLLLNVHHWREALRRVARHLEVQHLGVAVIPAPTQPKISCERRDMQIARLPVQ
jgi:hypothetical protein